MNADLSIEHALHRATEALLSRRQPSGYWEGRLASSPLATAVALCALKDEEEGCLNRRGAGEYLLRTQNPDGGWGDTERSKSNLAATVLALCAQACPRNPTPSPSPLAGRGTGIEEIRLTRPKTLGLPTAHYPSEPMPPASHKFEPSSLSTNQQLRPRHLPDIHLPPPLPASGEGPGVGFLPEVALRRAEAYVESLGGLDAGLARIYDQDLTFQVPIRMTAAYAGLKLRVTSHESRVDKELSGAQDSGLETRDSGPCSWHDVDPLPFELALAPRWLMGALGLPVVSYALPALVCVGLARHAQAPSWFPPLRWLRTWAIESALKRIEKMQPSSGGYLEAIPITAFCLIGLKAAGRGEHPVAKSARRFLIEAQRADGSWPVEVNLSVWNTTRAIDALAAAGRLIEALSAEERAATRDWLLAQQVKKPHPYTEARSGGWGWNHLPGSVPDADDTAGAIVALRHLGVPAEHPALQFGKNWLLSLQNRDGGWPTFCRGWQKLPFDRSAPDLTAHALRALQTLGEEGLPAYRAGWAYLHCSQRPDGSFAPLWFGCESAEDEANATYGTVHVLLACATAGQEDAGAEASKARVRKDLVPLAAAQQLAPQPVRRQPTALAEPRTASAQPVAPNPDYLALQRNIQKSGWKSPAEEIRARALAWLRSIQNHDGGFGGCEGAPSTAEETGLALRALAIHASDDDAALRRAAQWLCEHQRQDGSWEPAPIGFYFAVLWYYEEIYPLCYALGGMGQTSALRMTPEEAQGRMSAPCGPAS